MDQGIPLMISLKIHRIAKMLTLQKVSAVNDETLQLSAYIYIYIYIYIYMITPLAGSE